MPPAAPQRFPFRFERSMAPFGALFGVRPATTWAEILEQEVVVRFGPWHLRTPLTNIDSVEVSGPFAWAKVVGPVRLSFSDRGATFATNRQAGVCLTFRTPLPLALPGDFLRSPNLTVTVAEPERFRRALLEARPTPRS